MNVSLIRPLVYFIAGLLLIEIPFMHHPEFTSFSTSSSSAHLEYSITYDTTSSPLFKNDVSAFVVFTGFALDGERHIEYLVNEVTSSTVRFTLVKHGDTQVNAIYGYLVVVSSSLKGILTKDKSIIFIESHGFSSGKIIKDEDYEMRGVIGNRKDYTAKPQIFLSFSGVQFYSVNPYCRAFPELGVYNGMPYLTIGTTKEPSTITQNYDVLLFCGDGNNCLIPQKADLQTWKTMGVYISFPISQALSTNRTKFMNTAFPYFLESPPKYIGFGINEYNFHGGYNMTLSTVSSKHAEITITAPPTSRIHWVNIQFLLSNWGKLDYSSSS